MNTKRIVLFALLFLSSCIKHEVLPPEEWRATPLITTGNCPNLDGRYQDLAIEAPDNEKRKFHERYHEWAIRLSKLLLKNLASEAMIRPEWITVTRFHDSHGSLEITLERDGKDIWQTHLIKEKDFHCKKGYLVITRSHDKSNEYGISIVRETVRLGKTENGDVVAIRNETETGLAILIPAQSSITEAYLFPRMATP